MMNETTDLTNVIVNLSGGKDSTAVALWARDLGIAHERVFCDTGNEHPLTYRYLEYLESVLGPIRHVRANFDGRLARRRENLPALWMSSGVEAPVIARAQELLRPTGNPFLDLCLLKGRFPSPKARFCTQELKILPVQKEIIVPALKEGRAVECWLGVRRDESLARSRLDFEEWTDPGYLVRRPILDWSAAEVVAFICSHGIELNPLYRLGFARVGCMPCVMCGKSEVRNIAQRFPAEIARVREWERLVSLVSKRGCSTFFHTRTTPGEADDRSHIDAVVAWSMTSFGGRQHDWVLANRAPQSCASVYGLCE